MGDLATVFRFGWQYMRPYWSRLVAGVLLGILCGFTAGGFLWITRTLTKRLKPPVEYVCPDCKAPLAQECPTCGINLREANRKSDSDLPGVSAKPDGAFAPLKRQLAAFKTGVDQAVDEWLPRAGLPLNGKQIAGAILFLPLLALVRGSTDYLSNYCMGWVSERVINNLRYDVLAKLTSLSLDYFNKAATGDLMTRVNGDTNMLHRALRQGCADLTKEGITMLCVFGFLLWVDWRLTVAILVLLPVVVIPLVVLGKKARKAGKEGRKATVGQNSLLVEAITGVRVVKAFNLEGWQLNRYRELARQLIRYGMKGVQAKELSGPIIEVIGAVGLGCLVVYLFWSGQELEDLVTFVMAMAWFFVPVKKIASVHILFEQAGAGVERLVELLREQPTVVAPAHPKPLKEFAREIRFDRVSFSYGHTMVLQDIDLRIPRGFKLGIAGESGSGKSTLVNLLFRFYDATSGVVSIDGIDVRDVSFGDLREHMALVSQDVFVFRQTVAENIAVGRRGATREEIVAAARAANAHEFISRMPQGYETVVGERGMTLSGGQRQRIAIARAFIRNAPILVLDEATASLDSQSEAEVQAAINLLEKNRTVISVAHRLSTLTQMDQIVVLSHGVIVEQGGFQELLRAKGPFASMAARQGIFPTP